MFETIMVPTDGSKHAKKAEEMALSIAKKMGSKVVAVHIIDDKLIYPYEVLQEEGKAILQQVHDRGQEMGVEVHDIMIVGSPTHDIAKITQKSGADLMVISSHGRTGLEKLLMGSVAQNALKTVDIPILLVK